MPVRPSQRSRRLAPFGVAAVLAIAAIVRFWALERPDTLVFDEIYYVRDAISQLAHGYPTVWPDDDPGMADRFTSDPAFAVHPPLGKWLIGLGLLIFGDASGWGWRSAVALFGVATVAVTMRLGWLLSRSMLVSILAGLLLALDGVHIVLTRVGLLDGFLTFFVALGALLMWRDHEWVVRRGSPTRAGMRVLWWRPWLIAAAIAFGCAASVKWSGLYPLAAFLVLTAVRDTVVRLRLARSLGSQRAGSRRTLRAWWRAVVQAGATGIVALPVALATYVASWVGWIAVPGGWGRDAHPWPAALWKYHVEMFEWHSTLSAPHPYASHPLTWPLGLRPTAMYLTEGSNGTSVISAFPNLVVTWGGVIALAVLAWWAFRPPLPRHAAGSGRRPITSAYGAAAVLTGYLSGWLPWVLTTSRSAVFQFYAVVLTPFSALALALVLAAIWRRPGTRDERFGRRASVVLIVAAVFAVATLFFPVWIGMPVPEGFAQAHLWLPGWW